MSPLFRIVYAAHANGTHHKLALDALRGLRGQDAGGWTRVFLKHAGLYLEGSKAPDVSFKDFRNHVLHVGENYWGGAPEKVEAWYAHTVTALRAEKWADAAYAAGVLSHYYTDPIHPFHTGQTEAENSIHRAVEWSINRSYDQLRQLGEQRFSTLDVVVPSGAHWIREMVCNGAEFSHRYYEKLIAHYDFKRGVVTPPDGLDDVGRGVVAELLIYAATGFARLLERAIADSGVSPPDVSLTADTIVAALNIPKKMLLRRLTNAADRAQVERIYDELQATGRVFHSLPDDDRIIRDLHAREVLAAKMSKRETMRAERIPEGDPAAKARKAARSQAIGAAVAPAANAGKAGSARDAASTVMPTTGLPPNTLATDSASDEWLAPYAATVTFLALSDTLERAPSIGPKMATKFAAFGILTVRDFVEADPSGMAGSLPDKRVDRDDIEEWQDQARLVMSIPGVRGTHAQLLTGAGYRTLDAIANADPATLSADILAFATTSQGRRILREGNTPDIEKIKSWVDAALEVAAA